MKNGLTRVHFHFMKVFIVDVADGMTEKLVREDSNSSDFIDALKALALPPEKVFGKLYDIIFDTVKNLGFEKVELPKEEQPDYIIMVSSRMPIVKVLTLNDIQSIFVGKVEGNCIDRFMAHNMNTFTDRIKMWANVIEQGNGIRCNTNEYHDTPIFEADFKALTEIKNICEKMADKIRKFQENLTNGYK